MATAAAAPVKQNAPAKVTIPPMVKTILVIVGIVILIVLGIIAVIKVKQKFNELRDRKHIKFTKEGGEVEDDFDPGYYAGVMFNVMDGVTQPVQEKDNAAALVYKLNDNELIAVHNKWNDPGSYYDRNQETLYTMMDNEWVPGGVNWDNLKNRLSNLGLVAKT